MRARALWFYAIYTNVLNVRSSSSWTAEVPKTISALQGSCVVIPCKFNYPDPERESSHLTGIWYMTGKDQFIYHPDSSQVMEKFRGRTNLIGDLAKKNCSLRINHLRKDDNGPFIFRILIHDFNKFSYTEKKVSIDVHDSPASPSLNVSREVKAGEAVTALCSVSHSCPTELPELSWSHTGTPTIQSEELTNGQWGVTSKLTFTATNFDHNKNLTCTAKYQQMAPVQLSKMMNVKYAPVTVEGKTESAVVKEGDPVEMRCSSDSNPPAHSYQWYNINGTLLSKERIYKLHNVSRHIGEFYCVAINTEGQKNSTPVKISVEYPPRIGVQSFCTAKITGVDCQCLVDSRPIGTVQWILADGALANGSSINSPDEKDFKALHTLHLPLGLTDVVSCYASNKHGNEKRDLLTNQGGVLMAIYVSGLAASAFVLTLVILVARILSRRKKRLQSVKSKKNPIYSNRSRCDEHVRTPKHKMAVLHLEEKAPGEDLCAPEGHDDIYVNRRIYSEEEEDEEEEDGDYENFLKEDVYANI